MFVWPPKYQDETTAAPISLDYFLEMSLAEGGGGKEIIKQNKLRRGSSKGLLKVKDVVEFFSSEENIKKVEKTLKPENWQYYNSMMAGFRHNVADHHDMGWENMTKEYYDSLPEMTDEELAIFQRNNPVEFTENYIKHGYHRAVAMIGRLIKGQSYIPFYMKQNEIMKNPLSNFRHINELSMLPISQYCLTQSAILTLMGIRQNDDLDIIISSRLRKEMGIGDGHANISNVEIFPKNYDKFMVNGVKDDDDLILNYTFSVDGYKFLEPRFYFDRKNKITDRDKSDWAGIDRFFEREGYLGYPFDELTMDKWRKQ